MPDWQQIVREHLEARGLPRAVQEEVVCELAAHLEEICEEERRQGRSATDAAERELASVRWRKLARGIRAAKAKEEEMNRRTKSLWLPAMVNLVLSAALLVLFDKLGFQPRIAPVSHIALAFQPWIFALPLCGAVGALLARRAEGSRGARLIAGLAPSLVWLAVFSILGLVFACDRRDFAGFPLDSVALAAVGWVVLPALALLAGTAPFLGEDSRAGCRL